MPFFLSADKSKEFVAPLRPRQPPHMSLQPSPDAIIPRCQLASHNTETWEKPTLFGAPNKHLLLSGNEIGGCTA